MITVGNNPNPSYIAGAHTIKPHTTEPNHSASGEKPKVHVEKKPIIETKEKENVNDKDSDAKRDYDPEKDDVVATTEFGDTLQISEKGKETLKTETENRFDEEKDDFGDEKKTENAPSSFAGISDSQMREMYLKGEISRYEYETEIEQREELRKQDEEQADANNRNLTSSIGKEEKVSRTADAIRVAFKESSAAIPDAEKRLDMLKKAGADLPKAEEKSRPGEKNKDNEPKKVVKISVR